MSAVKRCGREHDTEGDSRYRSSPPPLGRTKTDRRMASHAAPPPPGKGGRGVCLRLSGDDGPFFPSICWAVRAPGRPGSGRFGRAGGKHPAAWEVSRSLGLGIPGIPPGCRLSKAVKRQQIGDLGFREPYFQRAQTQGDGLADEIILRAGPLD